jgi:ribulose-phosphate 3-epimerase
MALIVPALLAADFASLGQALRTVKAAGGRRIHLDVADGHFTPEITAGQPVIESIRKATDLELDVHLLVEQPERYVADFARAGANRLTVHPESTAHLYRTLRMIRRSGAKAGVALEPGTPVGRISELLAVMDSLTILSGLPGEPGAEESEFIPASLEKLEEARRWRERLGLDFELEVEGGVGLENAKELVQAGADILVVGSAIFAKDDPAAQLGEFLSLTSPVEAARGEGSAFTGS